MLEKILEHRLLRRLGQKRQHVNSDHAAFLRQRFQFAIFLVPRMHVNSATAGVSDQHRFLRRRDAVRRRLCVGMTEIERNADLIHPGHGAAAEIGQAVRVAVETTAPERRPVIVGKLHHAHAETAEQLDPVDLVLEHVRRFERINDAELSFVLRAIEIGCALHFEKRFRLLFHQQLRIRDRGYGLLEISLWAAKCRLHHVHAGTDNPLGHARRIMMRNRKPDRAKYVPVEYKHLAIQFRRNGRHRCRCGGSGRFARPQSVRLDRGQRHCSAQSFRKLPTTNHLPGNSTAIHSVIVARKAVWRIRSTVSRDRCRFVSRCNGAPCLRRDCS